MTDIAPHNRDAMANILRQQHHNDGLTRAVYYRDNTARQVRKMEIGTNGVITDSAASLIEIDALKAMGRLT